MHKKLFLSLLASVFLIGLVSAADYGYSSSYTVKEKYDDYGYSFYQKSNTQTPWGEKTQITQVKDYDSAPYYQYNDKYKNPVSDYWKDGPFHGYAVTYKVSNNYNTYNTYKQDNIYLDYHYSDSYNRGKVGSQYYDYYYKPTKVYSTGGAMYWDHGYNGWDCGNGYYCWK